MMHRRDFLKILIASSTAATVDWEKFLWIPGEKKIFIPEIIPISFDYSIAIPSIWTARGMWEIENHGVDEDNLTYRTINREQAIRQGVLRKGQGLEDIDNYMRHQIELSKPHPNLKRKYEANE